MDSDFFREKTIGIFGLGLIGGSYAKGLRKIGAKYIIGIDQNTETLAKAKADGVIDTALTTSTEVLKKADLIIFCMPAKAILASIEEGVPFFKEDVILTDVAGIKGHMAEDILDTLPKGIDFISGHPMAGREGSGYDMAQAEIFNKANYIIVPDERNKPENIDLVRHLALALGCAHVVEVTPIEHDKLIAYTSSLPHVLATSLVNSEAMSGHTKYFVAGSFRDGTRVADINAPMWTTLFMSNKDNLLYEIERFQQALDSFKHMLAADDAAGMTKYLEQATTRRRELIHETHTH